MSPFDWASTPATAFSPRDQLRERDRLAAHRSGLSFKPRPGGISIDPNPRASADKLQRLKKPSI